MNYDEQFSDDFIKARGYLTLGSRLKRIGERLQSGVYELARSEGFDVPAALFPLIGVLHARGLMTIGELAEALGISQPGVTRSVIQLQKAGLVKTVKNAQDRRVRSIALTPKCGTMFEQAKADLLPRIEQAVAAMCQPLTGGLLEQLSGVEDALRQRPLAMRAARRNER